MYGFDRFESDPTRRSAPCRDQECIWSRPVCSCFLCFCSCFLCCDAHPHADVKQDHAWQSAGVSDAGHRHHILVNLPVLLSALTDLTANVHGLTIEQCLLVFARRRLSTRVAGHGYDGPKVGRFEPSVGVSEECGWISLKLSNVELRLQQCLPLLIREFGALRASHFLQDGNEQSRNASSAAVRPKSP